MVNANVTEVNIGLKMNADQLEFYKKVVPITNVALQAFFFAIRHMVCVYASQEDFGTERRVLRKEH
jgi:hypothetical protein